MLELATRFGLHTVAEGVETADQLALLRQLGCDSAQGFHLHRPMPPQDVPALFGAAAVAARGVTSTRA